MMRVAGDLWTTVETWLPAADDAEHIVDKWVVGMDARPPAC